MGNSLFIRTGVSSTFNYLVYLQNIYLNQKNNSGEFRFPYMKTNIAFPHDFEKKVQALWEEAIQQISEHPRNDGRIFYEEKDRFFEELFEKNEENKCEYDEIYQSFSVWLNSFAGHIVFEKDVLTKLYDQLDALLNYLGITPQKELNICLIYDECTIVPKHTTSYFTVIPIRDFMIKEKELPQKLLKCIIQG